MTWRVAFVAVAALATIASCGTTAPLPDSWMRGVDFFGLTGSDFDGPAGAFAVIDNATGALPGVTHVAIQWMWHVDNKTANDVYANKNSPTIDNLRGLVRHCHNRGLKVLFKPVVVAAHGGLMFEINPTNATEWFASYGTLMGDVLELAYAENVDVVSVGLELLTLIVRPSVEPLWRDLIATARGRCPSCRLTYSSNPLVNETKLVPFWDALDFIGADLYVPLVLSRSREAITTLPDASDMKATFDYVLGKSLVAWYTAFNESMHALGRNAPKILITESGYPSSNYGMQWPWLDAVNCTVPGPAPGEPYAVAPNMTAQATAFETMFDRLTQPSVVDMFAGFVQFWAAAPSADESYGTRDQPGSQWACGWPVYGKPAGDVVAAAFARSP